MFIFFYFLKDTDIYSTVFILHNCYSKIATIDIATQMKYYGEYGLETKKSNTLSESYLFKTSVKQTKIIGFRIAPKL